MTTLQQSLCLVADRFPEDGAELRLESTRHAMIYMVEGEAVLTGPDYEKRLVANQASYLAAPARLRAVGGPARLWRWQVLEPGGAGERPDGPVASDILLARDIELDGSAQMLRCDRVDFPPGGIAHTHVHPGPGIRVVLFGEITIDTRGAANTYAAGEPWFERGPDPVLAPTTDREPTAFVRVMVLPRDWLGRNTIRYVKDEDAGKPKPQRYFRFADQFVDL